MDHCAYIREPEGARRAVLLIHGICSTPRRFDFLIRESFVYFFDDVQQIENSPEPEIDDSEDIANEQKI